jgi:3-isopropylmalate/(R)-2-methylmalate dehydratase small subunit
VIVSDEFLNKIFTAVEKKSTTELTVNLEAQSITINETGEFENFDINNYKKTCLLNGFDDIDYLLNIKPEIEAFEKALN